MARISSDFGFWGMLVFLILFFSYDRSDSFVSSGITDAIFISWIQHFLFDATIYPLPLPVFHIFHLLSLYTLFNDPFFFGDVRFPGKHLVLFEPFISFLRINLCRFYENKVLHPVYPKGRIFDKIK